MTNVVWFGSPTRLWKNCTIMLNHMLRTPNHVHYYDEVPDNISQAIVIVHGESCLDKVARLNLNLAKLSLVTLIYLGDECQIFPIEEVHHPNMRLWIQDPDPRRFPIMDHFLPGGWSPATERLNIIKDLDWFFAGQITHTHRVECAKACRNIRGGGFIIETRGYTEGVSEQEYNRCMNRAKFVPCPSGPHSPDSTRIWETLQTGGVPVIDATSPCYDAPDYWHDVLGHHPLITIRDWSIFPSLLAEELLPDFEFLQSRTQEWWNDYKKRMSNELSY